MEGGEYTSLPGCAPQDAPIREPCSVSVVLGSPNFGRVMRSLLLLFALLSNACGNALPNEAAFVDDLGRPVAPLPSAPDVVSLAPSMTEVAFMAGAGRFIKAVTVVDNYPPEVLGLPRISSWNINYESVVALHPDLALASDQVNSLRDGEALDALGVPTAFFSIASFEDVFAAIRRTGILLGTANVAAHRADSLSERLAALRALTAGVQRRPVVLFLISDDQLNAFGSESYMHELILAAGGTSATRDIDTAAPVLTDEYVLAHPPDVIIGPWGEDYAAPDLLGKHPAWADLAVIRGRRVFGVPADLYLRPGPRLVEGAEVLARRLHPELFPSAVGDSSSL